MRKAGLSLIGALVVAFLAVDRLPAADLSQSLSGEICRAGVAQFSWASGNGCYQLTRCTDPSECWERCPTANSADCVNNVCQYTLPGGGDPGGGSENCPQQIRCTDSSECVFFGGVTGTCVNNVCVC